MNSRPTIARRPQVDPGCNLAISGSLLKAVDVPAGAMHTRGTKEQTGKDDCPPQPTPQPLMPVFPRPSLDEVLTGYLWPKRGGDRPGQAKGVLDPE